MVDKQQNVSSDTYQTINDVYENVEGATDMHNSISSSSKANVETIRQEQIDDETLNGWWSLAKRDKGGFYIKDGMLYHMERILGQCFFQLCLPK